jgi:hypothetical protein
MEGGTDANAEADDEQGSQTRFLIVIGAVLIGLVGLLNLFFWFAGHGAFFSLVSAANAAANHAAVIDVDSSGFRFPMFVVATPIVLAFCGRAAIDLRKGGALFMAALAIIFSSFFGAAAIGDPVLDRTMAAYDYRRCAPGDHMTGAGKGRVWVRRYISRSTACVAA